MSTMWVGCSELGPAQWKPLSSFRCSIYVGKGLSSNLTACFHIITDFPSPALLSMLSKMFCHVLTESVALIIHNAISPLPILLSNLPPSIDLLPTILFPAQTFLSLSHMWAWWWDILSSGWRGRREVWEASKEEVCNWLCLFLKLVSAYILEDGKHNSLCLFIIYN